jgi:hypothetical protein
MKKVYYCFFFVLFTACSSTGKYAKDNLIGVSKIENNLYCETYCIYRGGVYAGNTYTQYLTDSTSFRVYLGTEEDNEQIKFIFLNDSIIFVYKTIDTHIMTEKREYNLYTLKREGKFE